MVSEKEKIKVIVEYFGFRDMDDATERLHEVLSHVKQEKKRDEEQTNVHWNHEIVDEIYNRIISDKDYSRPAVCCYHFSYLLMKIGEFFNHKCRLVDCNPDYLNNGIHKVVYDEKARLFRDPSVYKYYYDIKSKKWVFKRYGKMKDVPERVLKVDKKQ